MPREGFKNLTVRDAEREFFEKYMEEKHLRSISQAVEWAIRELRSLRAEKENKEYLSEVEER